MNRRDFIKLGAALTLNGCSSLSPIKRPNVLFIAIDDLNTWIGCLKNLREGMPIAQTLNIDRLARQGVLFSNAHTPVPWCKPARNNTLIGLYANTSGIYNDENFRDIQPTIKTIPQHFMDNGYQVLGGGKLFHDGQVELSSWHEYESFIRPKNQKRHNPALSGLNDLSEADGLDWGRIDLDESELIDVKIAEWAMTVLKKDYKVPFFLGVGFRYPHLPWYVPQKYLDQYDLESISLPWVKEDDLDDIPQAGRNMAYQYPYDSMINTVSDHQKILKAHAWKNAVRAYLGAITYIDVQVGKVLDALERSPYANNTIIVLWSDNGFHLGEKLHWRKFTLWDQATRVPLIIKTPYITTGLNCSQAVSLIDIYPTLIDLCSLSKAPHKLDGQSLYSLMRNSTEIRNTPVFTTYGKGNDSLVTTKWRYIRYADGSEELYDRLSDPYEWVNLAQLPDYNPVKTYLSSFIYNK